jgi:hypothetical protein
MFYGKLEKNYKKKLRNYIASDCQGKTKTVRIGLLDAEVACCQAVVPTCMK